MVTDAEMADLKGLCVANSLLTQELALVLAALTPERMEQALKLLGAVAEGSARARDQTRFHLSEAVQHLREQIAAQSEAP